MDIGVAKLDVNLVLRPVALVIEHQRAAEPGRVEPAVAEEVERGATARSLGGGDRALALDPSKGEVQDRAQHELPGDGEIPAHAARGEQTGPLYRDRGLRIGHRKSRVVAAVRQRSLQIQRDVWFEPAAA